MSHSLLPGIQWIFAICFYGKELSGGMGEAVLILQSYYEIFRNVPIPPQDQDFLNFIHKNDWWADSI